MELEVARWLVSAEAAPWLDRAAGEADPDGLATGERWRRDLPPERAAGALTLASLRRAAVAKLGSGAERLFLTRDGLEQATRPEVAVWRAARLAATGVAEVWDLGCGLGLDALALASVGLRVVAVERDPVTAVFASANLGPTARVVEADVEDVVGELPDGAGVFVDPARRTARGRSWDIADLSPSWAWTTGLLASRPSGCVKLGPGVPYNALPPSAETVWVSDRGDLVEASVWVGAGAVPGRRSALLLPGGHELQSEGRDLAAAPVGRWLYEPDPAVIRAGAVPALARRLGASAVAEGIAYLSSEIGGSSDFATRFEVLERLPYRERELRAWVRAHHVGTLEIKKRGLDVDPAALRRRLAPSGEEAATFVLTPTVEGAAALVVRRA